MRLFFCNGFALSLLISGATAFQLLAQETNAAPITPGNLNTNKVLAPPALPPISNPIDYFRELLAATPAQREKALAIKSPEQKRVLLEKLREYQLMTPEERELRLRATELRWQLVPLMRQPPIARLDRLSAMPAEDRRMVEERLRLWDELPAHLQKEFLENETVIHYFLNAETITAEQQATLLQKLPATAREKLESEMSRWRSLPPDQRQQMCNRFNQFFELTETEKKKTLNTLSLAEQKQMENTLQKFANLPTEQRKHCIESFRKFARLSPEDRNQFLENAQRWQTMSPSEREAWRQIVQKTPSRMPPLPPGFPPFPTRTVKVSVVTNLAK